MLDSAGLQTTGCSKDADAFQNEKLPAYIVSITEATETNLGGTSKAGLSVTQTVKQIWNFKQWSLS